MGLTKQERQNRVFDNAMATRRKHDTQRVVTFACQLAQAIKAQEIDGIDRKEIILMLAESIDEIEKTGFVKR